MDLHVHLARWIAKPTAVDYRVEAEGERGTAVLMVTAVYVATKEAG